MQTILNALFSNTITILATLALVAFAIWLYKKPILAYLQKKYNLFTEEDVITFITDEVRSNKSAYVIKNKLDTFKMKRNARKQ
jgi:hypothetical protein